MSACPPPSPREAAIARLVWTMSCDGWGPNSTLGMARTGYLVSVDSYMNLQVLPVAPVASVKGPDCHAVCLQQIALADTSRLCNVQLASTEEFIDGQMTGNLGEVLIRYACQTSVFVRLSLTARRCQLKSNCE